MNSLIDLIMTVGLGFATGYVAGLYKAAVDREEEIRKNILADGTVPYEKVFKSPRNGIAYMATPRRYSIPEYGAILDSTYEMTEQLVVGNGMTVPAAIARICADEEWDVLYPHRLAIDALIFRKQIKQPSKEREDD